MVEAGRDLPREQREWVMIRYGRGAFLDGPVIGRVDVAEGDLAMLERAGLIYATRYSARDNNPTYVVTPEGREHFYAMQDSDPMARQEDELKRFLESERFKSAYPRSAAKWTEADALLWRADSEREFTTIGHKVREAFQEFATEAVDRYAPPEVETNPALVNKRLGAIIAMLLPKLGQRRADLLTTLGDYSEATLAVVQRQEHGAQKEGNHLTWQDARRVVFHAASVMYEFAETFREAASPQ